MSVKAKFKCQSISGDENNKNIQMNAVIGYDEKGVRSDENESWSKYTPSGSLQINITNPDAFNQFEIGKEYYLTFDPA